MRQPTAVKPNTCETFSRSISAAYPEIHLDDKSAALILSINPAPSDTGMDEGTIVVAHFDSKNSNLLSIALTHISGRSGRAELTLLAANPDNEMAAFLKSIIALSSFDYNFSQVSWCNLDRNNVSQSTGKDCSIEFNPRLTITSLPAMTTRETQNPPSLLEVIRRTFLGNTTPSKFPTSDKSSNDVTPHQPLNGSPPKIQ